MIYGVGVEASSSTLPAGVPKGGEGEGGMDPKVDDDGLSRRPGASLHPVPITRYLQHS